MTAAAEHEHTDFCADMSRYCLVQVRVTVSASGRADVRVSMKPSASCWTDVDEVKHVIPLGEYPMPRSAEQAAETALRALRDAFQ